ncbi:IctB family putative bicarbonate transporter [Limnospira fusiformis KN01]|uniref:IctB family putative bicarbonate transporter n=1 Tax=Limnospira TaxID=2596745 RepID=UPI001658AA4C|nr:MULTISPECIES: IctB family putative bicarbonate transporter [Limnospira]MDT9197171.1 IctB family putative bicarbonate transporter [Limnospira sp. PMC 1042.18]ULB47354.1 IctB family putative bicarbonate transporter [Limnospira fusiformis KN01]
MTTVASIWQSITLRNLNLYQWRGGSLLYRISGSLRSWRQGSWFMEWGELIGALLVAAVFGLAPFVNTALIGVLLIACGGFWVLLTLSDEPSQVAFTPIHLLVLLYWGIATIATSLSPVKQAAFNGWVRLTLYLVLFFLMARVFRSPRLRSLFIGFYLHITLIVGVYGMRQWFFGTKALATWVDPTSAQANITRIYSYLGNPNLLAGYLIPAVGLSLGAILVWRGVMPKLLAITMAVVNSVCLVLTFSRGGWLGFVALLFTFAVLLLYWISQYFPPFWQKWAVPIGVGGLAALLVLAIVIVPPVRDRVATIFAGRGDSSNNFRINVWAAVIEMIRDRPILGIGPGNNAFNQVYPLYMRPRYSALSAYSVILEVIVETGFVGLTAFLWLLTVTFNQGWLQLKRLREWEDPNGFWLIAAIATLAGMLAHGLFDTVLYRPQVNTLWWLMVALIASYYLPNSQGVNSDSSSN